MKKYVDYKLIKYLTIFYTVVVLISIFKKAYWKSTGQSYANTNWFDLLFQNIFLDWVVVILFMIFISYLTKLMFERWDWLNWKKIVAIHLFFSFFIGYFIFFITAAIGYLMGDITLDQAIRNLSLNHFFSVIELNFLVYFAMIGIINVYYYIKKIKNIELQKAKIETHLANTRLHMLKAQLHPHFIFNTLNSISSLIEIDKEKSQNLIADFGDLFREILEFKDESLIPLQQEMNLLRKYIDIISVRFSDHLEININVEDNINEALVPNLLIQPLLENAIKYGYSYDNTELKIEINIRKNTKSILIEIKNDGIPLDFEFEKLLQKGFGLKNLKDRLNTLYKSDYQFVVKNRTDSTGVEALLKIPLLYGVNAKNDLENL